MLVDALARGRLVVTGRGRASRGGLSGQPGRCSPTGQTSVSTMLCLQPTD